MTLFSIKSRSREHLQTQFTSYRHIILPSVIAIALIIFSLFIVSSHQELTCHKPQGQATFDNAACIYDSPSLLGKSALAQALLPRFLFSNRYYIPLSTISNAAVITETQVDHELGTTTVTYIPVIRHPFYSSTQSSSKKLQDDFHKWLHNSNYQSLRNINDAEYLEYTPYTSIFNSVSDLDDVNHLINQLNTLFRTYQNNPNAPLYFHHIEERWMNEVLFIIGILILIWIGFFTPVKEIITINATTKLLMVQQWTICYYPYCSLFIPFDQIKDFLVEKSRAAASSQTENDALNDVTNIDNSPIRQRVTAIGGFRGTSLRMGRTITINSNASVLKYSAVVKYIEHNNGGFLTQHQTTTPTISSEQAQQEELRAQEELAVLMASADNNNTNNNITDTDTNTATTATDPFSSRDPQFNTTSSDSDVEDTSEIHHENTVSQRRSHNTSSDNNNNNNSTDTNHINEENDDQLDTTTTANQNYQSFSSTSVTSQPSPHPSSHHTEADHTTSTTETVTPTTSTSSPSSTTTTTTPSTETDNIRSITLLCGQSFVDTQQQQVLNYITLFKDWLLDHKRREDMQKREIESIIHAAERCIERYHSNQQQNNQNSTSSELLDEEDISLISSPVVDSLVTQSPSNNNTNDDDSNNTEAVLSLIQRRNARTAALSSTSTNVPPVSQHHRSHQRHTDHNDISSGDDNDDDGANNNVRTCCICMLDDAPVRTVFMPCKHMVCCEQCSAVISRCPVCRSEIAYTINVFL